MRRDAYRFELVGLAPDWKAALYEVTNSKSLRVNPSKVPIKETQWVESDGGLIVMLATHPPVDCRTRNLEVGGTQYYLLYDSLSPVYAPGTQLAGRYSLGFSSGRFSSSPGAPWTQAYLSQTGAIAADVQSIRFLARGSFEVFVGGLSIPVHSLGANAYAGDISAFAGTTSEFKIVNTSMNLGPPTRNMARLTRPG